MRKKIMKINQIVIQTLQITILPTIYNIPASHISRTLMVSPLSGETLDGRGKTKQPCQTAGLLRSFILALLNIRMLSSPES